MSHGGVKHGPFSLNWRNSFAPHSEVKGFSPFFVFKNIFDFFEFFLFYLPPLHMLPQEYIMYFWLGVGVTVVVAVVVVVVVVVIVVVVVGFDEPGEFNLYDEN